MALKGGKASGAAPRAGRGQKNQLKSPRLCPTFHLSPFAACLVQCSFWSPSVLRKQPLCILGGNKSATGQARTPIGQDRVTCLPFCPGGWCLLPGGMGTFSKRIATVPKPCLMGFCSHSSGQHPCQSNVSWAKWHA